MPVERPRRSFSNRLNDIDVAGRYGDLLANALSASVDGGYESAHGFHAYPGRMHPDTCGLILEKGPRQSGTFLDPFMGAGGSIVEAFRRGFRSYGSDLNPLAPLIARERTRRRDAAAAEAVRTAAEEIAAIVRARAGDKNAPRVPHRHGGRLVRAHPPHVFAEMRQWIGLVDAVEEDDIHDTLRAVFSSLVVKFSNQRTDSSEESIERSLAKGAFSRWMLRKLDLLLGVQVELAGAMPPGVQEPRFAVADARRLDFVDASSVDLCVTSPPYPGTYDYHRHHILRLWWLDLDDRNFERDEIGARRRGANESWSDVAHGFMREIARCLAPGGGLFLVVGDWLDGADVVCAREFFAEVARSCGLSPSSAASGVRPARFGRSFPGGGFGEDGKKKREHILFFVRG